MIECDFSRTSDDNWRIPENCTLLYTGKYCTNDYGNINGMLYSDYHKGYTLNGVWSKKYNSYLDKNETVRVVLYTTNDYRIKDDKTYYEYDGKYYDNEVKKEDTEW